jgi:uncharacterized protein
MRISDPTGTMWPAVHDHLKARIEMVVMQPTPFCPLACGYCYLGSRDDRSRMSDQVVEAVGRSVLQQPWAADEVEVLWHAGEPLVLPGSWYERAFASLRVSASPKVRIRHAMQTSGLFLDRTRVAFLRSHDVAIGLSLDGPDWLHDRRRVTRTGKGTLKQVLEGLRRLQDAGISPGVITVLGSESLDHADALHAFYLEHGIQSVGFNVEEIEGANCVSTLDAYGAATRFRRFMTRFWELCEASPSKLKIREFQNAEGAIFGRSPPPNPLVTPLSIVSVTSDGSMSTFCPELLDAVPATWGNFRFGSVLGSGVPGMLDDPAFRRAAGEIADGVSACRNTCVYYPYCGGGAPSNKMFERGSFAVAETMFCSLSRKAVIDVVVEGLEGRIAGKREVENPLHQ